MVSPGFNRLSVWFWSESVWLPPGIRWTDIPESQFTDVNVIYKSIPVAIGFIFVRIAFEWLIARPIGRFCGLPDPGSELPNVFIRTYRRVKAAMNREKYESKRRIRTMSGVIRPITVLKSKLDKFCECVWRFTYYMSAFLFGLWVLWDKPWFWVSSRCFDGYPYQETGTYIDTYYILEAGFYLALMITQFTDVQRKDFEMMFLHHCVTLFLIWASWSVNYTRVGSLIMVIHDVGDIPLELAKCFRYLNMTKCCDFMSAIFAIDWFASRCMWLPYHVLYTTFIEAPALIMWYPVYYIFNGLLLILQVLHIIWSWMIVRMVVNVIKGGEIDDSRSDDEEEDLEMLADTDTETNTKKNVKVKRSSSRSGEENKVRARAR